MTTTYTVGTSWASFCGLAGVRTAFGMASVHRMLWLGNDARGPGAAALRQLALGFGAVTSWRGRAIVPDDHPATLGAMHG